MRESKSGLAAEKVARFIQIGGLDRVFGGSVEEIAAKDGKKGYKSIMWAVPRYVDGEVRVYGETFILVRASNRENKVCKSLNEVFEYLNGFVSDEVKKRHDYAYLCRYAEYGDAAFPSRLSMWNKPKSMLST